MSIQEAAYDEQRGQYPAMHHVYPVSQTISGTAGARIAYGSNVNVTTVGWVALVSTANQEYQLVGVAPTPVTEEYVPEMVSLLLRLDKAPPEAKFNNVVDMMDWLDRD